MEDKETKDAQSEEVEGHGLIERPSSESPTSEAQSEEPDFEGHGLTERPSSERPSSE